ncbi:MAG: amphi-Trp domain-containing protein [Acidobacteriota bacterium]
MAATRKTFRSVLMTRESAAQVLSDLADGMKSGAVRLEGRKSAIALSPGGEVKLRLRTRGGEVGSEKGVLLLKLSWTRPRDATAPAAPAAPAKPAARRRRT